jgi:hypothetical protein
MLCGYIRFWWKPKSASDSLKSPSTPGQFSISECRRYDRSWAPSLSERSEISTEGPELSVTRKREVVVEPSVKSRFQVLE